MEDCDAGLNASGQESVDEPVVVVDSLFVDRVSSATKGDYTTPGDGEPIVGRPVGSQEVNVLVVEVVAVDGDVARRTILDRARNPA